MVTTHLPVWVRDGANTDAQDYIPTRADVLFIHHTSSIRSLIQVRGKTTAKLRDYREKPLRHLSCWWKPHGPLPLAGSRSIMRQVRQEARRAPTPLTCAVCALRSTARPVHQRGELGTADSRGRGGVRRTYLTTIPCCILISPSPFTNSAVLNSRHLQKTQARLFTLTLLIGRHVEHSSNGVWPHWTLGKGFTVLLGMILPDVLRAVCSRTSRRTVRRDGQFLVGKLWGHTEGRVKINVRWWLHRLAT